MDFVAVLDQVIALLRQRGRLTYRTLQRQFQLGVPGVISRKFSVREIATTSLLVARNDDICKNKTFCYALLHTPREM